MSSRTMLDSLKSDGLMTAPMSWFSRSYAVAVVAHLTANPPGWRGDDLGSSVGVVMASTLLGLSALLLLVRPRRDVLRVAAVLTLVTLWFELPVTGNHWLLMGFVALTILFALLRQDPWPWLSVTGRWVLLGFYCFAAFAKLNTGFLDPEVSCGVFYANQSLESFGLPQFADDGVLGRVAVIGPMLTELCVPVLLAFSRTRRAGVLLALLFHTAISLDLHQHFYDFTAVLFVLLLLFVPEETTSDLEARVSRSTRAGTLALTLAPVLVLSSLLPPSIVTAAVLKVLALVAWIPLATWVIVRTAMHGVRPASVPMRVRGLASLTLVALVIANALTPYLEVKTSLGFTMYANLVTVAGETNHLVVRRTLHMSSAQDTLLEVVRSNDDALDPYVTGAYLLPRRNVLDYLARHPGTTVTVRTGGTETVLHGDDGRELPLLARKFLTFRAVDSHRPPRCQTAWYGAY